MTGKYVIVIALTVLSFGLPVLYFVWTKKALSPFSLRQLTKSFNFALIIQVILAILYLSIMAYTDKNVYSEGDGTEITDVFMETGITYTVIGAFFYIPGLIILNLLNFLISRSRTQR